MTRISKPYLDPRLEWQDLLPISAPASYDSFVRFVFENGTQGDEKLDAALKECKDEVDLTNHCIAYCAQKDTTLFNLLNNYLDFLLTPTLKLSESTPRGRMPRRLADSLLHTAIFN
ncbi:hypothetical protein Q1695_003863 [Nippostrongylus brasiliensis]|nr:hypothetical protein Q1695_003863 [Nippostrongylus brasiliensis]